MPDGERQSTKGHKAHRSRVKEGYYKQQFMRTNRNKVRRAQARARRLAEHPKQA